MSRRLFDDLDALGQRLRGTPLVLLFLDFDGTLTPLVDSPEMADLPPEMRKVLQTLIDRKRAFLTLISGRQLADVQARGRLPGLIYVGNHGLEIQGPGLSFIEPNAAACRGTLNELAAELARKLQAVAGAFVEDKGLTLSVHYRQVAPEEGETVRQIVHATLANASYPFVLTMGHKIFNIRPRVAWDKGTAVRWIIGQLGKPNALPIYIGDDVTDEDAFAALREGVTVKVGNSGKTAARYQVADPAEVQRFLEWLADVLAADVEIVSPTIIRNCCQG